MAAAAHCLHMESNLAHCVWIAAAGWHGSTSPLVGWRVFASGRDRPGGRGGGGLGPDGNATALDKIRPTHIRASDSEISRVCAWRSRAVWHGAHPPPPKLDALFTCTLQGHKSAQMGICVIIYSTNSLPRDDHLALGLSSFQRLLKTKLFKACFCFVVVFLM